MSETEAGKGNSDPVTVERADLAAVLLTYPGQVCVFCGSGSVAHHCRLIEAARVRLKIATLRGPAPAESGSESDAPELTIMGMPAAEFIKRAYDLGNDLDGPGRYDLDDPVQTQLRHIKGWIEMAEHDALSKRNAEARV